MNDTREVGLISSREVFDLVSGPNWGHSFDAYVDGTLDCGDYDGETGQPIYPRNMHYGHGHTELDAINDLFDQMEGWA